MPVSCAISTDRRTGRATLRLSPPSGKPPTLDHEVLDAFEAHLTALENDPPRSLVVRSDSAKFFCVGANVAMLKNVDAERIAAWVEHGHRVLNRLEDLPCPAIARVTGYALGGGLELAMACDLIFTDRSAQLGLTEAKLGFIPGWGGSRRLAQRVGPGRAKQMFFAAQRLDAEHAYAWGLIDRVEPDESSLNATLDAYLDAIDACSAQALATFKRLLSAEEKDARERNGAAEANFSKACVEDADTARRLDEFLNR